MSTLFRIPTLRQELAFTLRLGPPTSTDLISDQGWPTPGGSWCRPSARSAGDGGGTGPVPPTTSISPSTAASSGQRSACMLGHLDDPTYLRHGPWPERADSCTVCPSWHRPAGLS